VPKPADTKSITGPADILIVLPNNDVRWRGYKINEITDGLSTTIMVGERPPDVVPPNVLWGAYIGGNAETVLFVVSQNFYDGSGVSPCPTRSYFSPGDLINHCHINHFWSFHNGGGNWLLCDASVRFMNYSAGTTVIPLMATINGGEVIPPLD
jgi:prepilin-type processing-associated H-X9-DG protein